MIINLSASLLFSSRLLATTLGYFFDLPAPVTAILGGFVAAAQFSIVFWPLAFLPTRAYARLASVMLRFKKLLVLRNLLRLHDACRALPFSLSTPVLLNPLHKWDYFRHTDLCIYNMVIAILDYKSCLKDARVVAADGSWLQALLNTDDDTDYQAQVQAYSQLGQSLSSLNPFVG